ncbi:hypothetical protein LZZ90_11665 [Flavobacterium sp. SM15]|uniref:hypothetical protein n=1 Tax=Flavobacterium sp. SM15 TaxID=2908005 RepID=UPI001EDB693A|nr:hypothetical protein [Flavobacterium sp. SM15]MCG2612164.1 hypothetical protein [Flavobacterium sp. SM15]
MKKVFQLLCFLMLTLSLFAQEKNKSNGLSIDEKLKKYEGTFQIQVKNPRSKPAIPYNIDEIIEQNRSENQVKYVQLGTEVRLMILPKKGIQKNVKLELISTY